jgi:glycosyltransferase involved in cell wall biosynthesis
MDPEIAKLHKKLDRLASAVADTRALAAAAVERIEGGRERLERIRAGASWRRAYEEDEPLVTVRIATWNRAELLVERALASVLRQTYERWEAVVIGDACTDDTAERVAALGDPRIQFHDLPVHGPYPEDRLGLWLIGGVPAMNEGLRRASGSWIAPLDDDDEWDDDHIEVLLDAAREDESEYVYGRVRCTLDGTPAEKSFGAWPPRSGEIGLLASIYNGALREFEHDPVCRLLPEGNDWHLIRRMWEAGVRFKFLDRFVATYSMDHVKEVFKGGRAKRKQEEVAGG